MNTENSEDLIDDVEFIRRFEAGQFPVRPFHHRDHIRVVWLCLRRHDLYSTIQIVSDGLRCLATAAGKPERYHETVTWAYVFLVWQRILNGPDGISWTEFAIQNTDLLDWNRSILRDYYASETLDSELARKTFLFPDR